MPIVEIVGLKKFRFLAMGGWAAISVDGVARFEARPLSGGSDFEIKDASQKVVVRGVFEGEVTWLNLLKQNGDSIMRNASGSEIARVSYRGILGLDRTVRIGQETRTLPRESRIELPGAIFEIDRWRRRAKAEIQEPELLLPHLAVAYYVWSMEDRID